MRPCSSHRRQRGAPTALKKFIQQLGSQKESDFPGLASVRQAQGGSWSRPACWGYATGTYRVGPGVSETVTLAHAYCAPTLWPSKDKNLLFMWCDAQRASRVDRTPYAPRHRHFRRGLATAAGAGSWLQTRPRYFREESTCWIDAMGAWGWAGSKSRFVKLGLQPYAAVTQKRAVVPDFRSLASQN